jgi:lactoylglutathione lyase
MAILPSGSLVLLVCANPEKEIEFYTQGLGFAIAQQMPNYTELKLGDFTVGISDILFVEKLLNINFTAGVEQRHIISLHSDAIDEDVKRLLALGATLVMPPTDQPWRQRVAYVIDPEENIIELAQHIASE